MLKQKRMMALVLCMAMVLGIVPVGASATGGVCVSSFSQLQSALQAEHTEITYEGAPGETLTVNKNLTIPAGTILNMNGTDIVVANGATMTIMETAVLFSLDAEVMLRDNSRIVNKGDLSVDRLRIEKGTVQNDGHIYGNKIYVGGTLRNNSSMTIGSTIEVTGSLQGSAASYIELYAIFAGEHNEIETDGSSDALQFHEDSTLMWKYDVADTAALQEALADFRLRRKNDYGCSQLCYLINYDENSRAADLVLTEDVTLPDNCHLVLLSEGESGSLTVAKGATLALGENAMIECMAEITIEGGLDNHGSLILHPFARVTQAKAGTYDGTGTIVVWMDDSRTDPFDDLYGFTEGKFSVTAYGYDSWHLRLKNPGSTPPVSPEIEFQFLSGGVGKYTFDYTDDFFDQPATTYNHELAIASLSMAMAAFDDGGSGNIDKLLDDLGMDGNRVLDYHVHLTNTVCYAIGSKQIKTKTDGEATLIAVAVCGAGYAAEWGGNFEVGNSGNHTGFQMIANEVLVGLQAYIARLQEQGTLGDNVKIWITGYSRASACANLTAAMLTDGYMKALRDVDIPPENIYAYCFEVPQGTTETDRVIGYENIFNIVNPIDAVPKVAPGGWGFGRYGITYYLPSAETDPNYSDYIMDVTREYTRIYRGTTENGLLAIRQVTNQGAALDSILDGISLAVSRRTFAENLQPILVPAVSEATKGENGSTYTTQLAKAIVEAIRENPRAFAAVIGVLKKALGSRLTYYTIGEQIVENILSAVGLEGATMFDTLEMWLLTVFHSHYPEVTLAWMHSVTGFDGDDTNPWYRRLYVNCPVDVAVYDSEDQLVAQIIEDEPQTIEGSMIPAYLDSAGQKIVILPPGEDYRVEITATDDGTMSYAVAECRAEDGQTERLLHYYDVEITEGDDLTADIPVAVEMRTEEYPLYMGETEIEVSEELEISEEEEVHIPTYTVDTKVLGHAEVYGSGTYLQGEYARLSYASDYYFLGWYDGDTLLSLDPEYRFRVMEDCTVTALFAQPGLEGGIDPDGAVTAEVWNIPEGTYRLLAARYAGGRMEEMQELQITGSGSFVFDQLTHADGSTWQIFLLEESYMPLCAAEVF